MAHFMLTAVGVDRPGIVAAVTGRLVHAGVNLEDTSMTNMRGHFAMMLVLDAPPGVTAADIERALSGAASDLGLSVSIRPLDEAIRSKPHADPWTLSVHGADKPGIVHTVTEILASNGVNILDLTTHVIGTEQAPVYAMVLDCDLPEGLDPADLAVQLRTAARELGIETSLHRADTDVL